MSTTAKRQAKKPTNLPKPAKRKSRPAAADSELRPFSIVFGKYLFWFTPEQVGFSVTCQNLAGVNAQGDTFEEALSHAVSMAEFVEDCQADLAKGGK